MIPVRTIRLTWFALFLLVSACSNSNNSETVTGKGLIRAIHTIPDLGTVSFLIEETRLATLGFKESSGISEYDDIEYTFNFDISLPGDTDATRIKSTTVKVNSEFEHTFVLAGSLDAPEIILWEQFRRDWAGELAAAAADETEITVMEVSFGGLSNVAGSVDVYLEAPGTSPLAASPKATIGYADLQTAIELSAGEYQLVLTPAGDPSTILFATDPIAVSAATSSLFTIMDDGGLTTADYSVRWIGTSLGLELFDINLQSEISVFHAGLGTDPVDIVIGGDFANPLLTGLQYTDYSPYTSVEPGVLNLNVIPTGNPGVLLAERAFEVPRGTINRLYLVGLPGALQAVLIREDHRTLSTHARMQVFQGAARYQTVDLYIVATDIDISLIGPTLTSFLFGTGTGLASFEPGDYNFIITEPGTKNVIGGPYLLNLVAGENSGAVILDSSNITATDVLFIELNVD